MVASVFIRLIMLIALLVSLTATAGRMNMAPGLWEIKTKSPELEKMMEKMPPEMRKQMSKGIKACMTKAQIARGYEGQSSYDGVECKVTDVKHKGNQVTIKTHCSGAEATDITTKMTHVSNKEWTSEMEVKSAQASSVTHSSGKWLKADCGNVKPL